MDEPVRAHIHSYTSKPFWLWLFGALCGAIFGFVVGGVWSASRSLESQTVTSDPSDYPAMRHYMHYRYSWVPDFLPSSIPASARTIEFEATDSEFLQASPALSLSFQLPPDEAQNELDRLKSVDMQPPDGTSLSPSRIAEWMYDNQTHSFSYRILSD